MGRRKIGLRMVTSQAWLLICFGLSGVVSEEGKKKAWEPAA